MVVGTDAPRPLSSMKGCDSGVDHIQYLGCKRPLSTLDIYREGREKFLGNLGELWPAGLSKLT